jgi:hypothetical protein
MQSIEPTRRAIEAAYDLLPFDIPLDAALAVPALKIILKNRALAHMQRWAQVDVKKLQSNDID